MHYDWINDPLSIPEEVTKPAVSFLEEFFVNCHFVETFLDTCDFADTAVSLLGPLDQSEPFTARARLLSRVIAETAWCRGVDNFLTYLSQLLSFIFRSKPETLRSSKTEKLDVILQFESREELIAYLAEKRVHDLAYCGVGNLNSTLEHELGFLLFPENENLSRATLIIETRNLIVHNRAITNDLFLKRTGATWTKPGDHQVTGLLCAVRCMRFLAAAANDIDTRAVKKFGLESTPLTDDLVAQVRSADYDCYQRVEKFISAPAQR